MAWTQALFNNCICRWIYLAFQWKDMMVRLFLQAKQNQTKGNKMDLKIATAALSGESPDLTSILFYDTFLFHSGRLEEFKRQLTTPDKHLIRTHFSLT